MDATFTRGSMSAEPSGTFSAAQFLLLLKRRAWIIVGCALIAAAATYAICFTMPRTYTASAMLSVDSARFLIPQLQGATGTTGPAADLTPEVRTEMLAVSSRQLVQGVVDQLHLATYPEFNGALRPPTVMQKITGAIKALLPKPAATNGRRAQDDSVLFAVTKALDVSFEKSSLAFDVSFTSQDPALSARVVNTLIDNYIVSLDSQRREADRGASKTLNKQVDQVSGEIKALQQKMSELRASIKFVELRAGSVGQQQLEDLATASTQASVQRAQVEATWQRAEVLARQGNTEALASVLGSPTIAQLREQEVADLQKVANLSQRYGVNYPGVQAAQADTNVARQQLREESQRIVASLASQVSVARAHEAETKRQLAVARQAGVQTADVQVQLDQLQREVDARRTLYQSLLAGVQQSEASQQPQKAVPEIRVVSTAVPPGIPSGPKTAMAVALAFFGGGTFGLMLAMIKRGHTPAFETIAEALQSTGIMVRASLPPIASGGAFLASIVANPAGKAAEELRVLRAHLRTFGSGRVPRSVTFTSSGSDKDASQVAAAFARVAAADGERVLLIEGGLHQPWLDQSLGVAAGGLPPVFEERADWREKVVRDAQVPLDLLLAGASPPRAATTLHRDAMLHNLIADVSEDYSLTVLDYPTAALASGTALLANYTDATILVVDVRHTQRAAIDESLVRLKRAGHKSIALALIGMR